MTENNNKTYTYTARNSNNPDKIITFTLINDHLRINLAGLWDQIGEITSSEDTAEEIKDQISLQAKPVALKLIEKLTSPTHVDDVKFSLSGDVLKVTLWQRLAGLRLAPVQIHMGQIDNLESAQAFAEELNRRKKSANRSSVFFGPLNYWAGWLGLFIGVILLIRWPRKRD